MHYSRPCLCPASPVIMEAPPYGVVRAMAVRPTIAPGLSCQRDGTTQYITMHSLQRALVSLVTEVVVVTVCDYIEQWGQEGIAASGIFMALKPVDTSRYMTPLDAN